METVIKLICGTTTTGGLHVEAVVATNVYPTKIVVSDADLQALHLIRETSHGDGGEDDAVVIVAAPEWVQSLAQHSMTL